MCISGDNIHYRLDKCHVFSTRFASLRDWPLKYSRAPVTQFCGPRQWGLILWFWLAWNSVWSRSISTSLLSARLKGCPTKTSQRHFSQSDILSFYSKGYIPKIFGTVVLQLLIQPVENKTTTTTFGPNLNQTLLSLARSLPRIPKEMLWFHWLGAYKGKTHKATLLPPLCNKGQTYIWHTSCLCTSCLQYAPLNAEPPLQPLKFASYTYNPATAPCSSGSPGTPHMGQAGLELKEKGLLLPPECYD